MQTSALVDTVFATRDKGKDEQAFMNQARQTDQEQVAEPLRQRLDAAGICGPGGRVIGRAASPAPVVIGRVCDAEPLFFTEALLGRTVPDRVIRGLVALALLHGAHRVILAAHRDDTELLALLREQARGTRIEVRSLPPAYPMDADSLICDLAQLEDRSVHAAGLDRAAFYDAVNLCDVSQVLEGRRPLRRTVTVAGEVEEPGVLQVPLGTTMEDLVLGCGGALDPGWIPFHNGLMGGCRVERDHVVGMDTRGVVILSSAHPWVVRHSIPLEEERRRVPSACVNCRICTDTCAGHLCGGSLQPHLVMRALGAALLDSPGVDPGRGLYEMTDGCRECGICSTLCPALLRPSAVIRALRQEGIPESGPPPSQRTLRPHPDRLGRRQSRQSLARRLGCSGDALGSALETAPHLRPRIFIPETITTAVSSSGDGVRVPVVNPGQRVAPEDLVALAPAGSGQPDSRSPVSGVVLSVDPDDGVVIRVQ